MLESDGCASQPGQSPSVGDRSIDEALSTASYRITQFPRPYGGNGEHLSIDADRTTEMSDDSGDTLGHMMQPQENTRRFSWGIFEEQLQTFIIATVQERMLSSDARLKDIDNVISIFRQEMQAFQTKLHALDKIMLPKGSTFGLGESSSESTEIANQLHDLRKELMAYISSVKEELTKNLHEGLSTNLQEISEIADLLDMQALKTIGVSLGDGISMCEDRFSALEGQINDMEHIVALKANQLDVDVSLDSLRGCFLRTDASPLSNMKRELGSTLDYEFTSKLSELEKKITSNLRHEFASELSVLKLDVISRTLDLKSEMHCSDGDDLFGPLNVTSRPQTVPPVHATILSRFPSRNDIKTSTCQEMGNHKEKIAEAKKHEEEMKKVFLHGKNSSAELTSANANSTTRHPRRALSAPGLGDGGKTCSRAAVSPLRVSPSNAPAVMSPPGRVTPIDKLWHFSPRPSGNTVNGMTFGGYATGYSSR